MTDYSRLRERMVQRQIAGRGVRSEKVLDAMRKVPRERFLPNGQAAWAYDDAPLPIGDDQTISQPYIVAYMTEALLLEGGEGVVAGDDAAEAVASYSTMVNERTENIGARRLHTIMEKVLDELSFEAPELSQKKWVIDAEYVEVDEKAS